MGNRKWLVQSEMPPAQGAATRSMRRDSLLVWANPCRADNRTSYLGRACYFDMRREAAMTSIIGFFLLGLFIGTMLGIFLACLCMISRAADQAIEDLRTETVQETPCESD